MKIEAHNEETDAMHHLRVEGDTFGKRSTLRRRGWRWQPTTKTWILPVSDEVARQIGSGGETAKAKLVEIKARFRGCHISLCFDGNAGKTVYISPTYVGMESVVIANDPYMVDGPGNYIHGTPIRGSDGTDYE